MVRVLLCLLVAAMLMVFPDGVQAKKPGYGPPDSDEGFVPPGQAKKQGYGDEGFVPPGQAKKQGYGNDGFVPPGQAKRKGPPPWAPAHGYRAKQKYRYYPGHDIYQDPASGSFFSFQGGIWIKGGLPAGLDPYNLGKYRDFDGYVDEPWENNPYKKRKY